MKNRFYLKTRESKSERFSPYQAYEVYRGCDGTWYVDDDNGYSYGSKRMSELEEHLRNEEDTEAEIIALAEDVCFFKYEGRTNEIFEKDKIYTLRLNKIDFSAENPYRNCIEGIETALNGSNIEERTEKIKRCLRKEYLKLAASEVLNCIFQYNYHYIFSDYIEWYTKQNECKMHTAKKYPKAELTAEEYQYVYDCIDSLLYEYRYIHTAHAVETIIDEWIDKKGELISAFKSHPKYNGRFQLVFSGEQYQLDTNKDAGKKFISWVVRDVLDDEEFLVERVVNGKTKTQWAEAKYGYLPHVYPIYNGDTLEFANYELYKKAVEERRYAVLMVEYFGDKYTWESRHAKRVYMDVMNAIYAYESDRVDENFAALINENIPEIRARVGQKTTKVVGKIMKYYNIDKHADYTKKFAAYCDAINIIKITRHTILSVHPCDYLTMSFGNSWSSCHTIDKLDLRGRGGDSYEGMYSSGTMSYMLDQSSFVLYTTDAKLPPDAEMQKYDKINRCMFHVMNERIVQGRCYPQSEDGNNGLYTQFRNLVQKVMSELWAIPNMWTIKRDSKMTKLIATSGTHYPDYVHFSDCNMSVFSETKIPNRYGVVKIGHNPICVECGCEHTTQNNINCCHGQYGFCPECGAIVDDDDNATEVDGEYYHNDCVFYCEYHERYEPLNEHYANVERYGDICTDAYNSGNFGYCEDCECYFTDDELVPTVNGYVCRDCLADDYVWVESESEYYPAEDCYYCPECNEYFPENKLGVDLNGDLVCLECGHAVE